MHCFLYYFIFSQSVASKGWNDKLMKSGRPLVTGIWSDSTGNSDKKVTFHLLCYFKAMLLSTSLVITLQPHCDTWLIYWFLFSLSFLSQAQSARLPHFGGVDVHFTGMIDCFIQVVRNKGILSLWTGLTANTIKASWTYISVIFFIISHLL